MQVYCATRRGKSLRGALLDAGAIRFRPILLIALSAMIGAATILSDPMLQGLAIPSCALPSSTLISALVRNRCPFCASTNNWARSHGEFQGAEARRPCACRTARVSVRTRGGQGR